MACPTGFSPAVCRLTCPPRVLLAGQRLRSVRLQATARPEGTAQSSAMKVFIILATKLTAAVFATLIARAPATRATTDCRYAIVGARLGRAAKVQGCRSKLARNRNQQCRRAHTVSPQTCAAQSNRSYAPKKPIAPHPDDGRRARYPVHVELCRVNARHIDGRVGAATRNAILHDQGHMDHDETGKLTGFHRHLLTNSYLRDAAAGDQNPSLMTGLPDGTKGLSKAYLQEPPWAAGPYSLAYDPHQHLRNSRRMMRSICDSTIAPIAQGRDNLPFDLDATTAILRICRTAGPQTPITPPRNCSFGRTIPCRNRAWLLWCSACLH